MNHIEQYMSGPAALRKAVAGLSAEQTKARPIAGKWSTLEVVCHLADFEPIHADRMKRIIAEEKPQLVGADEEKFAAALQYHGRDLEEELTIIEKTRSQMGKILKSLPEAAFQRTGIHTERGPLTLMQLLTITTNHIVHHMKFIDEKRQKLG